jgi:hypothetical protein
MEIRDFNNEQLRVIANIAQQYDVLLQARRELDAIPYHFKWHTSGDREYLYEIRNARGDGKSLGPRSAETEAIKSEYDAHKQALKARIAETEAITATSAAIWRSLKLPTISHEAAKVLQVLDTKHMLGESLLVVGTNAFAAYEIEAGGRFLVGWDATEDFDLAWTGKLVLGKTRIPQTLLGTLKEMDSTWTINAERTFQARNAKAYEIELLCAPSVSPALPPGDLRPLPLEEQEWLLWGTPLDNVVCSLAAKPIPARLAVPDPRWMALHKMWLSRQPKRRAEKRPKDARQGALLLAAVSERMPRFPLDKEFESKIPEALQPIYTEWQRVTLDFTYLGT